tara:strand:- start:632 stop:1105 length:474 start_codon:yes stop_codon:yes gene_type:complete
MILKAKILLIIGSAICLLSCIKDDDFDIVPILDFEEYIVFENIDDTADSALFKFLFTDGDGDIGSTDSTVFNCFLLYEEKNGDSIATFPEIMPREYSLPNLTPNAQDKNIEGSISLILKPAPIYNFSSDSAYRYRCYIIDRAGNKSNIISTGWNSKD